VLSSTIIRAELSQGRQPDPRALHPSVFEFIQQRGVYGWRPSADASLSAGGAAAAPSPSESSIAESGTSSPRLAAPKLAAQRVSPWGPVSKSMDSAGGGVKPAGGGHSPKAHGGPSKASAARTPAAVATEINELLAHAPPARHCHIVVLFGAHGTGKGTVSESLCSRHGYEHVSFGKRALMYRSWPPRSCAVAHVFRTLLTAAWCRRYKEGHSGSQCGEVAFGPVGSCCVQAVPRARCAAALLWGFANCCRWLGSAVLERAGKEQL
jgi:hypothetical protein